MQGGMQQMPMGNNVLNQPGLAELLQLLGGLANSGLDLQGLLGGLGKAAGPGPVQAVPSVQRSGPYDNFMGQTGPSMPVAAPAVPGEPRLGDWPCPNPDCYNHRANVFAKHDTCPKCFAAKPPEYRGLNPNAVGN